MAVQLKTHPIVYGRRIEDALEKKELEMQQVDIIMCAAAVHGNSKKPLRYAAWLVVQL
jgi:hypothetical protein